MGPRWAIKGSESHGGKNEKKKVQFSTGHATNRFTESLKSLRRARLEQAVTDTETVHAILD